MSKSARWKILRTGLRRKIPDRRSGLGRTEEPNQFTHARNKNENHSHY
jgi:hypothetical protein